MRRRNQVPGCIFINHGRYWWRVTLPGETRNKARPLIPDGGAFATDDLGVAEQVARDMYARAVFAAGVTGTARRLKREKRPVILTMAALVREELEWNAPKTPQAEDHGPFGQPGEHVRSGHMGGLFEGVAKHRQAVHDALEPSRATDFAAAKLKSGYPVAHFDKGWVGERPGLGHLGGDEVAHLGIEQVQAAVAQKVRAGR